MKKICHLKSKYVRTDLGFIASKQFIAPIFLLESVKTLLHYIGFLTFWSASRNRTDKSRGENRGHSFGAHILQKIAFKTSKKNGGFKSLVTSISLPVFQVPAQERTWEGSKLKAGWRSFACSDNQALNNREVFGIIIIDSFQEIISCSFSIIIYNIDSTRCAL